MLKSEQINEIAEALSILQGDVPDLIKNKQGNGYKYAELCQVIKLIKPHLKPNGLSYTQPLCIPSSDNKIAVETVIMHKSGQWISSLTEMSLNDPIINQYGKSRNSKAQDAGMTISFTRRYALCASFGLAADEDTDASQSGANSNNKATSLQVETLLKSCNNDKKRIDELMKWANIHNINDITSEKYFEAMEILKKTQVKTEGE